MGYLSLEDIYADDVEKYGHMRVGMTDLYVKDNHAIYGVVMRAFAVQFSGDDVLAFLPNRSRLIYNAFQQIKYFVTI